MNRTKKIIVVVDDSLMVLDFYTKILGRKGYDIITFSNPIDCYKYTTRKDINDDIVCILIDLKLNHEWSGYSLASAINLVNKQIPLIALSGYIYDFDKLSDFYNIFSYAFNKTEISIKELVSIIENLKEKFAYDNVQAF